MASSTPSETRVLHIMAVPLTGTLLVASIAYNQAKLGYQVEFACGPGKHLDQLRQLGFPVTVVPIKRHLMAISHAAAIFQLWRLLRRRQYHVVHTHTPIASFLGRLAAALVGTPVVIYHMRGSFWDSPSFVTRTIFNILEQLAGRWTSHIFTLNSRDASELVERNIVLPENVSCLCCGGGGIDTHRFSPGRFSKRQKQAIRLELGLKNSDVVIGFIGRLVQEKGVFELLQAFRGLAASYPQVRLLIVGGTLSSERDQSTENKIRQMVYADEELAGRVIFTGFRSDIPELISIMDIVTLPSYREGFGMVLAEASAMARPVVTTATRGGREAVIDGENGFLVPIGEVVPLREALEQLVSSPNLQHRMGQSGRRIALERFDERLVFEKIKTEYARLLREKGLPVPEPLSE